MGSLRSVKPVLVLRHGADIPPGYLGDVLAASGRPVETVPLYAGARVPDGFDYSAVVSLGGVMGAYDVDRYPYLAAEKRYLADAVRRDIPVLGICLGCQLLADALGGRAYRAPAVELGFIELVLSAAGARDPVVAAFDAPTLVWHQDTWDPPPDAAVLARTDRYLQAFRSGSALGIQPHPEATPEIVKAWVEAHDGSHFDEAGIDPSDLLAAAEAARDVGAAMATRLFEAWLRHDAA